MARAFVLVALLCASSASAAECGGASSCTAEQDEISLVQKMLQVEHGSERIPTVGSDMAVDAALTMALPGKNFDLPGVMDGFAKNKLKTKDEIQAKAADRIMFTNEQRVERKQNHRDAEIAVAADKQAVKKEIALDKAAVAETLRIRKEREAHAAQLVAEAKTNALAHQIKAEQAEAAATLGRRVGTIEGADAAKHAWKEYKSDVTATNKAEARAAARAKLAAREAADRAAVAKKTASLQAAEQNMVAKADRAAKAEAAKAAARAAVAENKIEGPEGLRNRMTEEKAEWAILHYNRQAKADQARIDAAASGNYPAGDWPVGPGDTPGSVAAEELAIDQAAWGVA